MWSNFSDFDFTITGTLVSDVYFGASKGARVLLDIILRRRQRTFKTFWLKLFELAQSGVIFAQDYEMTRWFVC